ncbi:MAG: Gfo/Idh/MocA family oxidoreductase [Clostridiaceae bacterium]|nr:Gfo/Idh/MocA family oxidoreductase [Clostridiaceae bacterium]
MSAARKINIGVIGVGWFGEYHARLYKQLASANLIGIYDADTQRCKNVADKLNVRNFENMESLLADPNIEAVSICTSDQYHLKPALAACLAGKHILIEKPLALSVKECEQIIAASKSAGIKLMVAHILRFNQRYVEAKAMIQAGKIGEVKHFYARRNNPRIAARRLGARCGEHTIIYHNSVHDIDIMNWLSNSQVVEAYAIKQSGELKAEGYELSDTVLSLLKFKNGSAAIMENCWIYPDSYPTLVDAVTEVTGSSGKIVLDFKNQGGFCFDKAGMNYFENSYWPEIYGYVCGDLHMELEIFLDCLVKDLEVPVSGEDGKNAVAGAEAIVASLTSGKPELVK